MTTASLSRATDATAASAAWWQSIPHWVYLIAGAAAIPIASLKWNVAALAWVAPVPFLLYMRQAANGWSKRLWLLLALVVGCCVMMLKILTEPVPWLIVPGYGVPIALMTWAVYLAWDAIRTRAGERWALYAFPALIALAELFRYRLTEFGVWGAGANTQLDDLRLLQLASLVGVSGISFVLAWFASLTGFFIAAPRDGRRRWDAAALTIALVALYAYGSVRLFTEQSGPTVRVAGIVADLGPTPTGFPDSQSLARNTDELFARSEIAASRGARVVVWNEAATVIEAGQEAEFVERGARLARTHQVDLVLGYIVPLTESRYRFENKYVWLSQDGAVLETYFKHHPVPGEGSVKSGEPLRVMERPYATAAGAICYDYDFPAMARTHARLGAGLVLVPSSDWRGIDPFHTQMARLRAIEGGFSIVRPVRWATSGAFDAYGRARASLSHFEANDRIMMATVPVTPVPTLYTQIGDTPALAYGLILLGAALAAARAARRRVSPTWGRDLAPAWSAHQ